MSCHDYHNGCLIQIFHKLVSSIKYVFKVYTFVYGVPTILFNWKKIINEPLKTFKDFALKVIRSMGFLGGYIMVCRVVACTYHNLTGREFDRFTVFLQGLFSLIPSLFERDCRRLDYSIFMYPRVIEGIFDLIVKLGLFKPIPNAEKVIFALSIAAVLVIMEYKREYLTESYVKYINYVFAIDGESEKTNNKTKDDKFKDKLFDETDEKIINAKIYNDYNDEKINKKTKQTEQCCQVNQEIKDDNKRN